MKMSACWRILSAGIKLSGKKTCLEGGGGRGRGSGKGGGGGGTLINKPCR